MLLPFPVYGRKLVGINLVLDLLGEELKSFDLRYRLGEVVQLASDLHHKHKLRL